MRLIDRVLRRYGSTFWEGEASGAAVLTQTYAMPNREAILPTLASFARNAYGDNGIVFGAILARLSLFSEARFQYQRLEDEHLWGRNDDDGLVKVEHPWPNGTTGELLARMIQDVDLAGNAYIWDAGDQLVRLRPDQVTIVSEEVEDLGGPPSRPRRTYRKVIGYVWDPNNPVYGVVKSEDAQFFDVEEIAHWSPIPDPEANFRGMSWLTPVIREITADSQLTDYKTQFLNNAATPNMILKYKQKLLPTTIDALREQMKARYGGVSNAFKTLILDQGADATVVGKSLGQMDFTTVQAAGENRILIASGVPGIVVGSKEGLMAATYSNYAQAMRRFSDMTMWPLWRSACACLEQVIQVPAGSRLWIDTRGIAALQQDAKDKADVVLLLAEAVAFMTRYGYEPASVVNAVATGDFTLLKHPGFGVNIVSAVPCASPQSVDLTSPDAQSQVDQGQNDTGKAETSGIEPKSTQTKNVGGSRVNPKRELLDDTLDSL